DRGVGLDLRRGDRSAEGPARQGQAHRTRSSASSESAAEQSGRRDQALSQSAGPGNEHGPVGNGFAREISGGRARLQQDSGTAIQAIRTRGENRRSARISAGDGGSQEQLMTPTMTVLTKKDFQTDQEVRWCPGCGDYAILSAVQAVFPELGIGRENFVVVSGIGWV